MSYLRVLVILLAACGSSDHPGELPDAGAPPDSGGGSDASSATCGNGIVEGDELCDGGAAVDCSSLTPVWGAGMARCRADCTGFDVAGCTPSAQLTDTVYPANRDPRWANARCNDQTPFAFQVQMAPARTDKWIVYFEGGGSCDGTYGGCKGRAGLLVSTKTYEADHSSNWATAIGVVLSRDPAVNPEFYDANMVFGLYCSSDGWSGTNTTPQPIATRAGSEPWVFTGRLNARALVDQLLRNFGLVDGTSQLLITGNSAGGIGAFLNVDLFARRMPRAIAARTIALLASAGWTDTEFHDPNFPYAGSSTPFATISADIEATYKFDADPKCLALAATAGQPRSSCAGGIYNYRAASAPAPAGWGIRTMIAKNREDAASMNTYGIPPANSTDPDAVAARSTWLGQINTEMAEVAWLYAPDDPQKTAADDNLHGMVSDPLVWPFDPPGFPGLSLQALTSKFWHDDTPTRVVFSGDVPHTESAQ